MLNFHVTLEKIGFTSLNSCNKMKWVPANKMESAAHFTKLSRTTFLQNTSGHLLLNVIGIFFRQTNVVLAKEIYLVFLMNIMY